MNTQDDGNAERERVTIPRAPSLDERTARRLALAQADPLRETMCPRAVNAEKRIKFLRRTARELRRAYIVVDLYLNKRDASVVHVMPCENGDALVVGQIIDARPDRAARAVPLLYLTAHCVARMMERTRSVSLEQTLRSEFAEQPALAQSLLRLAVEREEAVDARLGTPGGVLRITLCKDEWTPVAKTWILRRTAGALDQDVEPGELLFTEREVT